MPPERDMVKGQSCRARQWSAPQNARKLPEPLPVRAVNVTTSGSNKPVHRAPAHVRPAGDDVTSPFPVTWIAMRLLPVPDRARVNDAAEPSSRRLPPWGPSTSGANATRTMQLSPAARGPLQPFSLRKRCSLSLINVSAALGEPPRFVITQSKGGLDSPAACAPPKSNALWFALKRAGPAAVVPLLPPRPPPCVPDSLLFDESGGGSPDPG